MPPTPARGNFEGEAQTDKRSQACYFWRMIEQQGLAKCIARCACRLSREQEPHAANGIIYRRLDCPACKVSRQRCFGSGSFSHRKQRHHVTPSSAFLACMGGRAPRMGVACTRHLRDQMLDKIKETKKKAINPPSRERCEGASLAVLSVFFPIVFSSAFTGLVCFQIPTFWATTGHQCTQTGPVLCHVSCLGPQHE